MYHVALGLGSNLGDRLENLQRALDGLGGAAVITAVSPVYETQAWGLEAQPDFLNMCLLVETALPPRELLAYVKNLEVKLGRETAVRWGPRLIDIDILNYDELSVRSSNLNVPHVGMAVRATVLVPLADIAPQLVHSPTGKTVTALLGEVDQAGIRPFSDAFAAQID